MFNAYGAEPDVTGCYNMGQRDLYTCRLDSPVPSVPRARPTSFSRQTPKFHETTHTLHQ
ncbi:hypothetical protein DPMN_114641 [Dreissena polymorpha]|uniref:Uncharacterized protein n=1 Tax=Dreissena polymorpha TaxID=45954 RepID=A0A9D4QS79_DREPO|nr:hypothetical protein DPMN_114641 [Dreissena polymorpha]